MTLGFERIKPQDRWPFYKKLIPTFNENMKKFLLMDSTYKDKIDRNIIQVKKLIIDFYPKNTFNNEVNINDNLIKEIFDIMKELLEKDIEEIGIKVKTYLNDCCREKSFQIFAFKTILNYVNTSLKSINEIFEKNMKRDSSKENIISNCSFKVISDLTSYSAFFYQSIYPNHQLNNLKEVFKGDIEEYKKNIKMLLNNYIPRNDNIIYTNEQSHYFEDYLILLCKGICCYFFFKRIGLEIVQIPDLIKTMKFILDNTSMRDTTKDIYNYFLLLRESPQFVEEREYFLNENNFLQKGLQYTDTNQNEVYKLILKYLDLIKKKNVYTMNERMKTLEKLIYKLNNYHLNFEIKLQILIHISSYLEHFIKYNVIQEIYSLVDLLLKELNYFFEYLVKLIYERDQAMYFLKEGKKKNNKKEYLYRNMIEVDFKESNNDKNQPTSILFDILLSNEYDKYSMIEEEKKLGEVFNKTIEILKSLSKIFLSKFHSPKQNILQIRTQQYPQNTLQQQQKKKTDDEILDSVKYYNEINIKSKYLSKIFYNYLLLYELLYKNHKHPKEENSENLIETMIIDIYINFPPSLCISIFKQSMDKIFKLILLNSQVCNNSCCISTLLIDNIFKYKQNNEPAINNLKKDLFEVYFDYFSRKIYEIGNFKEEYDINYSQNNAYLSYTITTMKQLFKYILYYSSEDYVKSKITTLLVNCILLSKNSQYFGNYIYIIRCLFKYLNLNDRNNPAQYEFHREGLHIVYGVMKYMINFKEAYPFLKEMITEIIMILPLKFKYLIDFTHLIFPSIIDSLSMTPEIIPIGLQFLEQWMNALFHKPENVKPYLQKNILQLTTLLTSHLYKNLSISLNSLKLLSKFGGKSRNYLEDKGINSKTCPTHIILINLIEKNSNKKIDFILDYLVDICVKISSKKLNIVTVRLSLIILKHCFMTFIDPVIDYNYILKVKKDIINNIIPNDENFNSKGYFRNINENEEQVKINTIQRHCEHFVLEKILRGLFICFTSRDIENETKDLIKFIADYFVMAMIAKDKNNKNMHCFEIDPMTIFDTTFEFLFTYNPTVLRNPNTMCRTLSQKFLIRILDIIETIFDKDYKIIQHLEIIDIMFLKFLNSCYNNEWTKKGVGLRLIEIVINRFPKYITYKYIKYLFRTISTVASSYSNLVKIKFQNDCVKIIEDLCNSFIVDDPNYQRLTKEMLDMSTINDEELNNAKNNFIMMYNFVKIALNEIIDNINSNSHYEIKVLSILIQRIYKSQPLKKNSFILFNLNTEKISLYDLLEIYNNSQKELLIENIFKNKSKSDNEDIEMKNSFDLNIDNSETKINSKIFEMISALNIRLGLIESNFNPLTANCLGMIFVFKYCPKNIVHYIFSNNAHFDLFINMIQTIYETLLCDLYMNIEVTKYIKKEMFLLKFKHIFIEKLYLDKKLSFTFYLDDEKIAFKNKIDSKMIEEVEKYIEKKDSLEINEYNQNDSFIPEIFPILSEKMKMIKSYIKLLKYIFINEDIKNNLLLDEEKNKIFIAKKLNCLKLIKNYLINREEDKILNASNKFLYSVLNTDSKSKMYFMNNDDLKKYIKNSLENLKIGQNARNLDSLIFLFKSIIYDDIFDILKKKLDEFNTYECTDSALIQFYAFISLFTYYPPERVRTISTSIFENFLNKFKILYTNKNFSSFQNSKYKKKIIKLFSNIKENFAQFICIKIDNKENDENFVEFFKSIILNERSYIIRETVFIFFKEKLNSLINEIEQTKYVHNYLRYYLKYIILIIKKAPKLLKKDDFMKNLNYYYLKLINLLFNQHKIIEEYIKILKYITKLNEIYLMTFTDNRNYFFYLFNCFSHIKNEYLKNRILSFCNIKMYSKVDEKMYKNIMLEFINDYEKLIEMDNYSNIVKYFIIPISIKYFKENNFLKTEIIEKEQNDKNENNQENKNKIEKQPNHPFILNMLLSLTRKMYENNNLKEINNIEKFKLTILIILIFSDYYKNNSQNNSFNEEINNLYLNIQKLCTPTESESNQDVAKLYWLLLGTLFTNLNDNFSTEKIESIFNTFKNISDDYNNLAIASYEIILPNIKQNQIQETIKTIFNERQNTKFFQCLVILIQLPYLFKKFFYLIYNLIFRFIYRAASQYNRIYPYHRRFIVQLTGTWISFISNERKLIQEGKTEIQENLNSLELIAWKICFKIFKAAYFQQVGDPENLDLLKKIIIYVRELFDSPSQYEMMLVDLKEFKADRAKMYFHAYIYLIKTYIFFFKKEVLYNGPDNYFIIYKILSDNSNVMNIRISNDFGFVMRALLDENIMNSLNSKPKLSEENRIENKYNFYVKICEVLETDVHNISKIKIIDFENDILPKDLNVIYNKLSSEGAHDKIMNTFPSINFKFFILFKNFIDDFYKYENLDKIKTKHNISNDEITKVNKNLSTLLNFYFNNFVMFTIAYLDKFKLEEKNYKSDVIKDTQEYFSSTHCFYCNLKGINVLKKMKNENIILVDINTNEKPFFISYPDTIFCGFLFFFQNKSIMENSSNILNELFVKIYSVLKDKTFQTILEDLISTILENSYQTISAKAKLLLDILNTVDYIYAKISLRLLNLTCDFISKYSENPNYNKLDININNIIRILVYTSHNLENKTRQKIIKLLKKYNGNELIDTLKWMFTFKEWEGKYIDSNTQWLSYSVDILLSHFQGKVSLEIKGDSTPKIHPLHYFNSNKMDIEIDSLKKDEIYDKNGYILDFVKQYNSYLNNRPTKSLMNPIREIILYDMTFGQKIFISVFPQIWKILPMKDREILNVYICDFLTAIIKKGKFYSIIKILIETFGNCYPLIKIPPELLLSLTRSQNSWTSSFFYLENLFINNIERERSYHCLIKILDNLQEDQQSYGLKQFMTENSYSISALSNLQIGNYYEAENIITEAFKEYKDYISKIDLEMNNEVIELSNQIDFSIWQSGLIDCYKNTDKWNEIVKLSDSSNDLCLKVEGLWNSGRERWEELNEIKNKSQYPSQINQIYIMMKGGEVENINSKYQQRCMNCIKTIYQDFTTFPPNLEKLNYYYFLIFQLIVEAWESTNTLKETGKNILEKKPCDLRDNLITWRDRLPHICEGFQSLKSILEPRNYLFILLRNLIEKQGAKKDEFNNIYPNISDKIWNDMMFIKYARKLKLYEVYFNYLEKYEHENKDTKDLFPYVNYLKNIEELKYIRKISYNYHNGIELCDKYYEIIKRTFPQDNNIDSNELCNDMTSSYIRNKAYFLYKSSKITEANYNFKKACELNPTDYHIYYDWAAMCEDVVLTIKGDDNFESVWFENTMTNYFMVMIYKLDKAKFIIPRILYLIKIFDEQNLNNYNIQLENLAPWVWLFWLPILFDNFKQTYNSNKNDFFFSILKYISINYNQAVYYPLSILEREIEDDSKINNNLKNKIEQLKQTIKENDKLNHVINKIEVMINEIKNKVERSRDEDLLSIINTFEMQILTKNIDEAKNLLKGPIEILITHSQNDNEIKKIANHLKNELDKNDVTIFKIYEILKRYRYYLYSKLTTENNYTELTRVFNNKLYNMKYEGVEIPGIYSNKIIEPSEDNVIKIYRFESEYTYKFLNFLNKRLLIRGTNDKIFNFTLSKERYGDSNDIKILQFQCLLNYIFSKNKDTYKQKIKFNVPIKYFINNRTKMIQEETSQYYMNDVLEFCLQKKGYDPEIAYSIYEEEAKKYSQDILSYDDMEIKEKVFYRMCHILPVNSFKSFVHKFITSADDIFVFRKQFATSYGLNSILGYIFLESIKLNNISFNKETGSCAFHDIKYLQFKDRKMDNIRLTKNISYFLTPQCLYGIIPTVIYATASAIFNKSDLIHKILFCVVFNNYRDVVSVDDIQKYIEIFMRKINYLRNCKDDLNNFNDDNMDIDKFEIEYPLKIIYEIIENSINEENLKKMPLFTESWF